MEIRFEVYIREKEGAEGIITDDLLHTIGKELLDVILKISTGNRAEIVDYDWERFETPCIKETVKKSDLREDKSYE